MMKSRYAFTFLSAASILWGSCGSNAGEANLGRADKIVIVKSARTLSLMNRGRVLREYKVALGSDPVGPKARKGDHKTPEGEYVIDAKKDHSRFYKALHISYPNQADKQRALSQGKDPGGDVEIHGVENGLGWLGSLHRTVDWTDGCVALTDAEMDEIWDSVAVGTVVEIRP
jgi:murein L,D-transpeptidase YafK